MLSQKLPDLVHIEGGIVLFEYEREAVTGDPRIKQCGSPAGPEPIHPEKCQDRADAGEKHPWELRSLEPHGLIEAVHGVWREHVYDLQPAAASGMGDLQDRIFRIKDADQYPLTHA